MNPLLERLGRYPVTTQRPVWIHAASIGEVTAARSLIKELEKRNFKIFLSTITPAGRKRAIEIGMSPEFVGYLPVDLKPFVQLALSRVRPRAVILVETELWPCFITEAARMHIPVILVSGCITEKSYRNWKIVPAKMRIFFRNITVALTQTPQDADRLNALGVSREKLIITGNIKFDREIQVSPYDIEKLRHILSLKNSTKVLVAGSTRPGEEEIIIKAYLRLRKRFPETLLVIAPRHIARAKKIKRLISGLGLDSQFRTHLDSTPGKAPVIILNTLGELVTLYAICHIPFVGGTLRPYGGHNLLEPAALGKPVLFGPYTKNVDELAQLLTLSGGGFPVSSESNMVDIWSKLLLDDSLRDLSGQRAREAIEKKRGILKRTMDIILKYIPEART
jgi:3-deoxy-D-manno-octulosonic-acid transferase